MSTRNYSQDCVAASWVIAGEAMAQKVITLWHPYNRRPT